MSEHVLDAHLERWERKYEQMKKLSERWQFLFSGANPKSTIGQFPHPEWGDEIAQLEAERDCLLKLIHWWDLADMPQDEVDELLADCKKGIFRKP